MDKAIFNRLQQDYPQLSFHHGSKFLFRPPKNIYAGPDEPCWSLLLLHEVGHALCGHLNFGTLAERLKMEREAWEKARELCTIYSVPYDEDIVERELDTYRNWLDQKSRCPNCGLTRFQTPDSIWHCPRCENL